MGRLSTVAYALAAGLSFAGVGCASIAEQRKEERGLLERRIEREVQKHGSWTRDVLRNNYTIASVGSRVGFVLESVERLAALERKGMVGHAGAFDPQKLLVIFPETGGDDIVDAVDHELGHVVMRFMSERKEYAGPSISEIGSYCAARIAMPDLAAYREVIRKEADIAQFNWLRSAALKGHSKFLSGYQRARDTADEYIMAIQGEKDIDQEVKMKLGARWGECMAADDAFRQVQVKFIKWLNQFKGGGEGEEKEYEPRFLQEGEEHFSAFNRTASKTAQVYNLARDDIIAVQKVLAEKRVRLYEKELEERKAKGKDPSSYELLIEHYKSWLDPDSKFNSFGWHILEIPTLNLAVRDYNKQKVGELSGGDELFARMVDSLASCHFGPLKEMDQFELAEDDLKFMAKFTWQGEKIFSAQIEKYTVGKRMKADGIPPREIRASLEHAESFEYKGRTYAWPKSGFKFRGELPLE